MELADECTVMTGGGHGIGWALAKHLHATARGGRRRC
jgi:NAD(P)-dependent dehydrogenase (short-subunit alcohol dehydrogenase family)